MIQRLKKLLVDFWIVIAFGFAAALLTPQARAALIGVEDLERERVKTMLERPEVARALEKAGVNPQQVQGRVDAMSDAEVLQLAGRLDAAIAGGQLSNESVLLIVIIILLIILII